MDDQNASSVVIGGLAMGQVSTPLDQKSGKESTGPKVRRRNRMITSCLECRRRKLKCDKSHPCTNCTKYSRDCMFLAPALDSISQKKLNEIKEKMGSLERTLEEDIARRASKAQKERERKIRRTSSADLPGEGSSSDEAPVPEDEKGLEPINFATVDAAYDDDTTDDVLDLGFRVGKFRMNDRLGGLFRPKIAEEMINMLRKSGGSGTDPEPQLCDNHDDYLEAGPNFIAPGSGFVYGDIGSSRNLVDFLPTKAACEAVVQQYYDRVHFISRVVHWPSFRLQLENFWQMILGGVEPPASLQALVFSVMFSAVASMSEQDVMNVFNVGKRQLQVNFQTATEVSLGKAKFLRTTKIETLQAFIIYLIPMCREEVSRAHSVLVGAAVRLGECFGLHRDPVEVYGMGPVDAHIRRIAWFQLCWMDLRTAEAQGPRPSIKREDYDTKLPWNLDDVDLLTSQDLQDKENQWTDMTFTRLRFECVEMMRIAYADRVRLDKKKTSLTHVLAKIESFRSAMTEKYAFLDLTQDIQQCARMYYDILGLRLHIMVLHKFHNVTAEGADTIPDRLRQITLRSGTEVVEKAFTLDREPRFERWRWLNGSLQQWHILLLLLAEVYAHPNRREADRIWACADYVFQPDPSLDRVQKGRSIMGTIRDRAYAYRNLRKMREPLSMQATQATLPARSKQAGSMGESPAGSSDLGQREGAQSASPDYHSLMSSAFARENPMQPETAAANDNSWTMDAAFTPFVMPGSAESRAHSQVVSAQQQQQSSHPSQAVRSPPQAPRHLSEPSPSSSSGITDSWPPVAAPGWRVAESSPPYISTDMPRSPPGVRVGNSAMGMLSNQYIPPLPATAQSGADASHSQTSPYSGHESINTPPNMPPYIPGPGISMAAMSHSQRKPQAFNPPAPVGLPDIDWSEWDKLFPPDTNHGDLDLPMQ